MARHCVCIILCCFTQMNIEDCRNRIRRFVAGLQSSGIHFLFFRASNMSQPLVRTRCRKWRSSYVVPSIQNNGVYVYQESQLRYIVHLGAANRISPDGSVRNATIIDAGPSYDVHHGDHLDFTIYAHGPDILIKSHITQYQLLPGTPYTFLRDDPPCNFILSSPTLPANLADFSKLRCMAQCRDLGRLDAYAPYTDNYKRILYDLCKITVGMSGGRRRLKGGMMRDVVRKYKTIEVMSDQYLDILKTYLFEPLVQACPHLASIQLLYDSSNELAPYANENVVVLYDFEDGVHDRFMLDVSITLMAAYSLHHQHFQLTQREIRCKEQFLQQSQSVINRLAMMTA